MNDLETTLKLKHLSKELVSLAVARDTLLDSIFELANREVDGTPSCTAFALPQHSLYSDLPYFSS